MFNRHWYNGVAAGLVVGIGITVLILVWWYGPVCGEYSACGYPHGQEPPYDSFWYDTAAQWVAAVTSLLVAIFTFITILLVRQAIATDNAALNQSKEQTLIAQEALRNSLLDSRPWLVIAEIRYARNAPLEQVEAQDGPLVCFDLEIEIRNVGKSVATGVSCGHRIGFPTLDIDSTKDEILAELTALARNKGSRYLLPGDTTTFGPSMVIPINSLDIRTARMPIPVRGSNMVDGRNYFHFHLVAACVYRTDPKGGFGRAIKVFSVFVDIAKFDNSALATTVTESDVQ